VDVDYQALQRDDGYLVDLGRDVWLMDNHKWALWVWELHVRLQAFPDLRWSMPIITGTAATTPTSMRRNQPRLLPLTSISCADWHKRLRFDPYPRTHARLPRVRTRCIARSAELWDGSVLLSDRRRASETGLRRQL